MGYARNTRTGTRGHSKCVCFFSAGVVAAQTKEPHFAQIAVNSMQQRIVSRVSPKERKKMNRNIWWLMSLAAGECVRLHLIVFRSFDLFIYFYGQNENKQEHGTRLAFTHTNCHFALETIEPAAVSTVECLEHRAVCVCVRFRFVSCECASSPSSSTLSHIVKWQLAIGERCKMVLKAFCLETRNSRQYTPLPARLEWLCYYYYFRCQSFSSLMGKN